MTHLNPCSLGSKEALKVTCSASYLSQTIMDRTFAVTSLHLFVCFTFDCFNSIEMMDMESMKKKMDSSDLAMIAGE